MVTRQQARREGKKTKLIYVPDIIDSSVSPDELRAAQVEDSSFEKIRGLVGQILDTDAKVHFIQKKGMIYRTFQLSNVENGGKLLN